jgi:hypothetical protein
MNKLTDGNNKFDEITAFTTSLRCRVVHPDDYSGMAFVMEIPEGCIVKGKDIGAFRVAVCEDDGHRIQKLMKERRIKDTSQLHIQLEDDGYIRFSIKR